MVLVRSVAIKIKSNLHILVESWSEILVIQQSVSYYTGLLAPLRDHLHYRLYSKYHNLIPLDAG